MNNVEPNKIFLQHSNYKFPYNGRNFFDFSVLRKVVKLQNIYTIVSGNDSNEIDFRDVEGIFRTYELRCALITLCFPKEKAS